MPHSYYQLTGLLCCVGYRDKRYPSMVPADLGVVLFISFFKATFNRQVWQVIDMWIGGKLVVWVVLEIIQY